jgi:hypothetical protein
MSNPLSVRRVMVQTLDEQGNPEGEPTYGVMAADGYGQAYNDTFNSVRELNEAIDNSESILSIVDERGDLFPLANHGKIGHDNFYGKDWEDDAEI